MYIIAYNKINKTRKELIIIKTIEEVRKSNTHLNQTDFAKSIGTSYRSYQERLTKKQEWKFKEIAKAAAYNKNQVKVDTDEGVYEATIKRVG